MSRALADYERHLASERDLSKHTVRAYVGDVVGLLERLDGLAAALGVDDLHLVELEQRLERKDVADVVVHDEDLVAGEGRLGAVLLFEPLALRLGERGLDAVLADEAAGRPIAPTPAPVANDG